MRNTLVGYFNDMDEARRTQEDLIASGFDANDIELMAESTGGGTAAREDEPSIWERMKEAFGFASKEDRAEYEAAARAGGALLAVTVPDEQVDPAADIIERHHPAEIEQRVEGRGEMATGEMAEGETIPVAEEELAVGTRAVRRGGVRIHQHVTEVPVEETVHLRDEEAYVERRPVDRAARSGDDVFRERDVEVTETREEPVVAKETRIVEEIDVGKRVRDTEETVRDTVRRTEVDIEEDEDVRRRP